VVYILGELDTKTIIDGLLAIVTGTEFRPVILSASWGFPEEVIPVGVL
jgi:hypothetical protein